MNLWNLFPEFLLSINGILRLPYLTILFYIFVVYALIKNADQRKYIAVFLLLTLVASGIMFINQGPQIGKFIAPLTLLFVMVMPLIVMTIKLHNKSYREARIWLIVTSAGWFHSISWSVWLFALAGS